MPAGVTLSGNILTVAASIVANTYHFTITAGNGTFANVHSASTTFTMPGNATIITAIFTYMGGSGSSGSDNSDSGSGDGGGGSTITTDAPDITWMTASNLLNPSRSTGIFGVRGSAWARLARKAYHHVR